MMRCASPPTELLVLLLLLLPGGLRRHVMLANSGGQQRQGVGEIRVRQHAGSGDLQPRKELAPQ